MNLRENYEISRKAQLFLAANAYLYLLAQSCCLSRLTRAFGRAAVRKAPLLPLNTNRWLHNLLFPCFRILCVSLPESCGNCISTEDTKTDMFLKCSVHGLLSQAEHLRTVFKVLRKVVCVRVQRGAERCEFDRSRQTLSNDCLVSHAACNTATTTTEEGPARFPDDVLKTFTDHTYYHMPYFVSTLQS